MDNLPIKIRGLSEPDLPMLDDQGIIKHQEKAYIASCWSKTERKNPVYFWVSPRAFHYQFNIGVVCFLLDERPDLFGVAVNTDKPDQLLGWICKSGEYVFHYHVKSGFEQYGIANLLHGEKFRYAKPEEFERLINDIRKNTTEKDRVSASKEHPRQDVSTTARTEHRAQ